MQVLSGGQASPRFGALARLGLAFWQTQQRQISTDLRSVVAEKIPAQQERLVAIKKAHANKVIGDVTVGMCIGGMRGIKVSERKVELGLPEVGRRSEKCFTRGGVLSVLFPLFPLLPLPVVALWFADLRLSFANACACAAFALVELVLGHALGDLPP